MSHIVHNALLADRWSLGREERYRGKERDGHKRRGGEERGRKRAEDRGTGEEWRRGMRTGWREMDRSQGKDVGERENEIARYSGGKGTEGRWDMEGDK